MIGYKRNSIYREIAYMVLFLLIFATTSIPVASSYYCRGSARVSHGINIATLAVTKNGEGVVIPVYIEVSWPGKGDVDIVYNTGNVSADTIASIKYATYMASRLAGVRHNDYDYKVVFNTTYSISGLSATLDFALGFTLLLEGNKWSNKVAATGLLAPNGVVGNISGLQAKFKAAIESGYKYVIAPYHPALINNENYIPVTTFIDSYEYFSNTTLYPVYSRFIEEYLLRESQKYFQKYYDAWKELYSLSKALLNSDPIVDMEKWIHKYNRIRENIRKYFETGLKALNESVQYINEEKYYTAASRAFYGYWNILTVYLLGLYTVNDYESTKSIIEQWYNGNMSVSSSIIKSLINKSSYSLTEIDVLVNSYERLIDSEYYMSRFNKLFKPAINETQLFEALTYAAVALARQYTVRQWAKLIEVEKYSSNTIVKTISVNTIAEVANEEIELTKSLLTYLEYLFGADIREYGNIYDSLRESIESVKENPLKALAYVIHIQRDLSSLLMSIPLFTYYNDFVVENIRKDIVRVMYWYQTYYGSILPSGFTALEFMMTSINQSLWSTSTALLHLEIYSRIISFEEKSFCKPATIENMLSIKNFMIPHKNFLMIFSIVLIAISAFLFGFLLGKEYRVYSVGKDELKQKFNYFK